MTQLSPLEEVLFQTWARAHGVDNHDDPNNQFDHRGLYKQTNGMIMPGKVVRDMAASHNVAMQQQDTQVGDTPDPFAAQATIHGNMLKAQGDQAKLKAQAELEDKKHQNKMQLEKMKLDYKAKQDADKREQDRQDQLKQTILQRHFAMQDQQVQRQHALEDQQASRQHELSSAAMQEQFARTRPQPQESSPLEQSLMQRQVPFNG